MQSVDMDGNPTMMEWNYYGNKVRTLVINGDPWFVASDICNILEIDASVAVNGQKRRNPDGTIYQSGGLDDDEKGTHIVSTPGGPQEVLVVSEPGLYSLIMKSRKPIAKPFQRWVTHEVLPSIRKTGEYKTPGRRQECDIAAKQVAVMEMKARTEQAKLLVDAVHRLEHRLSDLLIERILIASTNLMAGYDAIGIPTDGPSFTEPGRTRFPDLKPYWKPF